MQLPEGVRICAPIRPVISAADIHDVMLEQLEYLIEHAQGGLCGCSQCDRYLRTQKILMEPFGEPELVAKAVA